MAEVKVSIVTPVYNVEKCIKKTIESIINQTYKDFELILIDDGSPDKSIQIAEDTLKNTDVQYKVIHQENSGVSAARNRGIEKSEGEYIFFLDSDDYIHKDFLKEMADKIDETSCDILFSGYSEVDAEGNVITYNRTKWIEGSISGVEAAKRQLLDEIVIGMRNTMYKSYIIKNNDIKFDSKRKYGEDMVFVIKALIYAYKVCSVNKVLAYYVIWESAVTQVPSLKHLDCYYSYVELYMYIKSLKESKIEGLSKIEKIVREHKIPYSVAHIFSMLSRDERYFNDLFKFLDKEDVQKNLKEYKIQTINKYHIKYFIENKMIRFCPKLFLKVLRKLR
ncbi:glycosyltransferase family 2 protein [Clostridium sp. BJN0001]|uniref:glycosyltransferase family 2 protein n=1 Tax=Clostridium sp. BJN0001 TaxID=2930219 RepID=UPI001FD471F8|nr:glycosyltransferase family 2 protein [Clostridium sp. BJN0001]